MKSSDTVTVLVETLNPAQSINRLLGLQIVHQKMTRSAVGLFGFKLLRLYVITSPALENKRSLERTWQECTTGEYMHLN